MAEMYVMVEYAAYQWFLGDFKRKYLNSEFNL